MKVSAIQKKFFRSRAAVTFANTTLTHLPHSITLYNMISYHTLMFTIKNLTRHRLPNDKIGKYFFHNSVQ